MNGSPQSQGGAEQDGAIGDHSKEAAEQKKPIAYVGGDESYPVEIELLDDAGQWACAYAEYSWGELQRKGYLPKGPINKITDLGLEDPGPEANEEAWTLSYAFAKRGDRVVAMMDTDELFTKLGLEKTLHTHSKSFAENVFPAAMQAFRATAAQAESRSEESEQAQPSLIRVPIEEDKKQWMLCVDFATPDFLTEGEQWDLEEVRELLATQEASAAFHALTGQVTRMILEVFCFNECSQQIEEVWQRRRAAAERNSKFKKLAKVGLRVALALVVADVGAELADGIFGDGTDFSGDYGGEMDFAADGYGGYDTSTYFDQADAAGDGYLPDQVGDRDPQFGMSTTVGVDADTGNPVVSSTAESAGGISQDVGTGEAVPDSKIEKPPTS